MNQTVNCKYKTTIFKYSAISCIIFTLTLSTIIIEQKNRFLMKDTIALNNSKLHYKILDGLRGITIAVLVVFPFVVWLGVGGKNDLRSLSDFLDHIIDHKEQYIEIKEDKINSLKKLLIKKDPSLGYVYEINDQLCNEYKKYKLDSAIHYALQNTRIAQELDSHYLTCVSAINLASIYSFAGKTLESEKILKNIDTQNLPEDLLPDYYETYARFYEHYATTSNQNRYYFQVELYRDSLLYVLEPSTYRYKIVMAYKYIQKRENDKAEELLNSLLEMETVDSPEYALITSYLGIIYRRKGESELEKKYFIMSAIADVKNSIKENASFMQLARISYNKGDLAKAFRYTQVAIEDAVFSGVQFRTAEMAGFYSIINASYQVNEANTNNILKRYLALISMLSVFLILLVLYVYKQLKKLSHIKEELSQANIKLKELILELNETNNLMNERNEQLSESNQIKEQYIAQFFHQCSSYIDKMENYRKTLYKLAINRHYEELIKKLKSTTVVENELEGLFAHFDVIFLGLYPNFVSDFNALLSRDEHLTLKSDGLLTRELRIYALLRLGITDGTQIASFLRCSLSTIYNYRTKMRNKAASNRNQFEDMVMKIGISKK